MPGKKYYWLKLHRDFFKRHDVKIVEAQENGKDYIIFYLKLLTECIDHEGKLRFSDELPYDEKMLSIITDTNIDIVRSAVSAFTSMGLMERWDDGTYFMSKIDRMIGTETEWAAKKRDQRALKGTDKDIVPRLSPPRLKNVRQELETELEIEIEKEKIYKKEVVKKVKHGEYNHVLLTDKEHGRLITEWGDEETARMIQQLDEGIELKGYKYKSHNLAIRKWRERDPEHGETREQRIMREIVEAVDG